MADRSVRHPLFARLYHRMSPMAEAKGGLEHRRELLAGIRGRVVEIGAGNGLNFAHYPAEVTEVVAVEPEVYLRAQAQRAASAAAVPITVVAGTAEALPSDDASFDVAVFSLVLCSVRDPAGSLGEARRVLKPGGELRFYEHVRAETPRFAAFQRRLDAVWPMFGGGCHTARDTESAVADAGFEVERSRRFRFAPFLLTKPVAPHVLGVARRPAP